MENVFILIYRILLRAILEKMMHPGYFVFNEIIKYCLWP